MRSARLFAVALLGLLFFHTAMAPAQGRDPPVAEALFREGREAMKKKDYASACPKFEESQRLDPSPGTLLNLAECEEPLGKLASAWQHLQEAIEVMTPDDKRIVRAKEKKLALDPRVPRLTIKLAKVAPSGTRVKRDDVELGSASLGVALPVNVGDHLLTVAAPGHREARVTVSLEEGAKKEVEVSPGEEELARPATRSPSGAVASPISETPPSPVNETPGLKIAGYALGVAGIIGVGVGVTFAFEARDTLRQSNELCIGPDGSTCPNKDEQSRRAGLIADTSRNKQIMGTAFGVGGALILGGVVLILVSHSGSSAQKNMWVSPFSGNHVSGLTMGGDW